MAVTLLRASGELGDWGYFPTPEAQCLRDIEVEFAVECHQAGERFSAFRRAKAFQVPFTALQVAKQEGRVAATGESLEPFSPQHRHKSAQQPLRWLKMKKDMSFVTTI